MAIIGVIDQDDYGATFERDDGTQLYLTGPKAKEFAAQFGPPPVAQQEPPPPPALYNDVPAVADALTQVPVAATAQNMSGGGANMSVNPGASAGAAASGVEDEAAGVSRMPTAQEVSSPHPGAAPPPRTGTTTVQHVPDDPISAELNRPVWVGGSPGRDPNRENQTGVMLNTGQTVKDALPNDPEDVQARADANINYRLAQQEGADMQAARYAAIQERAKLEGIAAQKGYAQAQERLTAAEEEYKRQRAETAKFMESAKVDPQKFFRDRGTMGTIAAAIAQGIGAYAAVLGGTGRNYAQEMIDAAIERDIRTQEAEIKLGKDNALRQLQESLGDLQLAKQAARMTGQQIAQAKQAEFAALSKRQDVLQAHREWDAENQIRRQEQEQKFKDRAVGSVVLKQEFVQPKAATSGYQRAPTRSEINKRLTGINKTTELVNEAQGRPRSASAMAEFESKELAKARAKAEFSGMGSPKDQRTLRIAYGKERSKTESATQQLKAIQERFEAQAKKYGGNIPGIGTIEGKNPRALYQAAAELGAGASKDAILNRQMLQKAINTAVEANKGAASEGDVKRYADAVIGGGSEPEIRNGIRGLLGATKGTREAIDAAYGKDVVSDYEKSRSEVRMHNYSRDKAKKPRPSTVGD